MRAEPIGGDFGFASSVARLHLSGGACVPATVIAKLPIEDERGATELAARYRAEVEVYARLGAQLGVRVPRCYTAERDDDGGFVLLLEDLAADPSVEFGDVAAGCADARAHAVIDSLAALHAKWWESPRLAGESWLSPFGVIGQQLERLVARRETFFERYGELVPDDVADVTRRGGRSWRPVLDELVAAPETLVHIDTHLDNIAFRSSDDGVDAIVFDWQGTSRGCAALDVALFLGGSLEVEHRRSLGDALLRRYHAGLVARGVRDYPYADFERHYAAATLRWWIGTVNGCGSDYAAHWSGRAAEVARLSVRRRAAALVDAGVVRLLAA